MNIKLEITKLVAEQLGLPCDPKSLTKFRFQWWKNPRVKPKGGLELTDEGFNQLVKADIKYHKITTKYQISSMNKILIQLDNQIESPWYYHNGRHIKSLCIFGDRLAVQLILLDGDLNRYAQIKSRVP